MPSKTPGNDEERGDPFSAEEKADLASSAGKKKPIFF